MYPQPWNCCVAEDSLGITEFLPTSPESWDYYSVLPLCLCSAGTGTWGFMYAIQIPYSWATSLSLCLVFFLMSAPPSVLQTFQIVWYPVHFLHQVMHAFSSSHVEVAGVLTTEWLRVWINSIFPSNDLAISIILIHSHFNQLQEKKENSKAKHGTVWLWKYEK